MTATEVDSDFDRLDTQFATSDLTALAGAEFARNSFNRGHIYLFDLDAGTAESVGLPLVRERSLIAARGLVTPTHVALVTESCIGSTVDGDTGPECEARETWETGTFLFDRASDGWRSIAAADGPHVWSGNFDVSERTLSIAGWSTEPGASAKSDYALDVTEPDSVLEPIEVEVAPHCNADGTQSTLTFTTEGAQLTGAMFYDEDAGASIAMPLPTGFAASAPQAGSDGEVGCSVRGHFMVAHATLPITAETGGLSSAHLWDLRQPEHPPVELPAIMGSYSAAGGIFLLRDGYIPVITHDPDDLVVGYPDTSESMIGDVDGVAPLGPIKDAIPTKGGFIIRAMDDSWWRLTRS